MSQTETVVDASTQLARFHESYTKNPDTDCWEWNLHLSPDGYGRCYFNGVNVRAHRLSYELYNGAYPRHFLVLHKCDNPKCVNPEHLRLGTHQDNMQDKKDRKRSKGINKGVKNRAAKLSDEDVIEIQSMLKQGIKQQIIADHFGVFQSHISRIKNGHVRI